MFPVSKQCDIRLESQLVYKFMEEYTGSVLFFGDYQHFRMYTEVHIPQIKRRSDLVILTDHGKLINIEFKLHDAEGVLKQAKDHKKWADYSVACLPAYAFGIQTSKWITKFAEEGIGIIVYAGGTFVEMMRPYYVTCKAGKDRSIRSGVATRMRGSKIVKRINANAFVKVPNKKVPVKTGDTRIGEAALKKHKKGMLAIMEMNPNWKHYGQKFALKPIFSEEDGRPTIQQIDLTLKYF